MITLITCTGHRPIAFKLCVEHVTAQTYAGRIQWIVINDDTKSADLKPLLTGLDKRFTPELYQGPENWRPGVSTLKGNMEQAFKNVKGSRIFFIEDDDYYSPQYLSIMNGWLDQADVVGESNACYYNLKVPGWRRMQNYQQASLAQTGVKAEHLGLVKAACSMNGNIDGNLWELAHKQGLRCMLAADFKLSVGMKGLPGRPGLGIGHVFQGYLTDPNLAMLRKWLGDDALKYTKLMQELYARKDEAPRVQKDSVIDSKKVGRLKGPSRSNPSVSVPKGQPKSQAKKSEAAQSSK